MKPYLLLQLLVALMSVGFVACGDGEQSSPNSPGPNSPGPNIPSGLFRLPDQNNIESRAARTHFLENQPIEKLRSRGLSVSTEPAVFNVNTIRNTYTTYSADNMNLFEVATIPAAPILDPYDFDLVGERFLLSVALPFEFLSNAPTAILNQLGNYPIEHVDLFFTAQYQYPGPAPLLLKPHFWVRPDLGYSEDFAQNVFLRSLLMGVFESDGPMGPQVGQVPQDRLALLPVSIHSQRGESGISPPGLAVPIDRTVANRRPMAFWSLVIHAEERRAAISLHWLLGGPGVQSQLQNYELREILQRTHVTTMRELLAAFRDHPLRETYTDTMLEKLQFLLRE